MSEERSYTPGTKEALYMLSRGHCYMPDCKERVMRWSQNGWYLKAQICHIYGLNDKSARYNEKISIPERNSFKNLILLCVVHHKLIDGKKTWMHYSVDTLTKWKGDREGDLADELDLIDWITQEKLQELMVNAVEEMLGRILRAIDNVSNISEETIDILKSLVDKTLKLPYLDPEDIASLEYCAEVFEILPEYIPTLHESAYTLKGISEYIEILYLAARKLEDLPDNVDLLSIVSRRLESLGDHAPQLLEAAQILSGQSLFSPPGGLLEVNNAVNRLQESISSLSLLQIGASGQQQYELNLPIVRAAERRPWNYYWWGIATCAIFVMIVLGLWAYAISRK